MSKKFSIKLIIQKLIRRCFHSIDLKPAKVFGVFCMFGVIYTILIGLGIYLFTKSDQLYGDVSRPTEAPFRKSQNKSNVVNSLEFPSATRGFLVSTNKCQIPDLDPFAPAIRMPLSTKRPPNCLVKLPLTNVVIDNLRSNPLLVVHQPLSKLNFHCCYSEIIRPKMNKDPDDHFSLSNCTLLHDTVELSTSLGTILVTCKNALNQTVYSNIHVLIPPKVSIKKRLDEWTTQNSGEKTSQPISVILFGIDAVSRMNLRRAMPKTAEYVATNDWFEMAGYNKIDDGTYLNLMAILTGHNSTNLYKKCKSKQVGGLDKCPIIWTNYRNAGYVTAYAEDEQEISTFNYLKKGFKNEPTDLYLRPVLLAAEQYLRIGWYKGAKFCLGFKTVAEYVYNCIFQLRAAYRGYPLFGLFWTNSFSHNGYESPTAMDERVLEYLKSFKSTGILDESIVVFLSDHGTRWGAGRAAPTGHLEERLPFFFISLPPSLKERNPNFVQALKINKNRLTTPFDFHVTLKHILALSGRIEIPLQASDCPKCQSLFSPIPENRSCEDAALDDHWCTCRTFRNIDPSSWQAQTIVRQTIDYINQLVKKTDNGSVAHLCERLVLKKLLHAKKEVTQPEASNATFHRFKIEFKTDPGEAWYDATVRLNTKTGKITVRGSISRLTSYRSKAKCVNIEAVKKYCVCKNSS